MHRSIKIHNYFSPHLIGPKALEYCKNRIQVSDQGLVTEKHSAIRQGIGLSEQLTVEPESDLLVNISYKSSGKHVTCVVNIDTGVIGSFSIDIKGSKSQVDGSKGFKNKLHKWFLIREISGILADMKFNVGEGI